MIRYDHPEQPPTIETDWSAVSADPNESATTRELAAELDDGQHRD